MTKKVTLRGKAVIGGVPVQLLQLHILGYVFHITQGFLTTNRRATRDEECYNCSEQPHLYHTKVMQYLINREVVQWAPIYYTTDRLNKGQCPFVTNCSPFSANGHHYSNSVLFVSTTTTTLRVSYHLS